MDIKFEINNLLVEARRQGFKHDVLLMGNKEYEMLVDVCDVDDNEQDNIEIDEKAWSLSIIRVASDSYLKLAGLLPDQQSFDAERLKVLTC